MAVTIGGYAVLQGRIREPKTGAWTAQLELDVEGDVSTVLSGRQTLDVEGVQFVCTVRRGDLESGRMKLDVVGGAGGLERSIAARDYFQVGMAIVLADLMRDSGEALDPTSDTAALNARAQKWVRSKGEALLAVRALADHLGVSWRVQRSGLLWLGTDTWLPSDVEFVEESYDPETGVRVIAPDDSAVTFALVRPGTTVEGLRVSHVETTIDGSEIRQTLTHELEDGRERGGPWTEVREFVRRLVEPGLAYARGYVGTLHAQRGDRSVDLRPDGEQMRSGFNGVSALKMRHGLPGVKVTGLTGGRLTLLFDEGSPSKPYAALWEDGTGSAEQIEITVGTLRIVGDLEVTGEVTAKVDTAPVAVSTLTVPSPMGPLGPPIPGTPTP